MITAKDSEPEHLVVLFGAGASIHAGIPLTAQLTTEVAEYQLRAVVEGPQIWIRDPKFGRPFSIPRNPMDLSLRGGYAPDQLENAKPIYEEVLDGLKRGFWAPNFEHILAAIEELQSVAESQNRPMVDNFKNVLAPFIKVETACESLREPTFLWYSRGELIKLVSRIFQDRFAEKQNVELDTQKFIERLRERYRVSIFTLNYDDLPERAGLALYDGFSNGHENFWSFNRREFQSRMEEKAELLCHLHGSIRFGYPRGIPQLASEIVKYGNSREALQSMEGFGKSETNVKGSIVSAAPLISGFNKIAKLSYCPIPYGYYYRALGDSLIKCPRLIIVGYGGLDDHINTCLREFMSFHEQTKRVVYVTMRKGEQVGDVSASDRLMLEFAAPTDFIHSDQAWFDEKNHPVEFSQYGNLALCAGGFPLRNDQTLDRVLNFLST